MKKIISYLLALSVAVASVASCELLEGWPPLEEDTENTNPEDEANPEDQPGNPGTNPGTNPDANLGDGSGTGDISYNDALAYVFDMDALPEIRVDVSLEEWNKLLGYYDEDPDTDKYIKCDAQFRKDSDVYDIEDAGLRLRGNTSRRRPEAGEPGSVHIKDGADWQHCHFMLNLRKNVKDDAHTIKGVRKIHLKWFKDDATYAREAFCYDLFRRYGIPTAIKTSYCRLWINVEGDSQPAYYGVYLMLEAVDDEYVEAREDTFGDVKQNLWKCGWGADLLSDDDSKFCNDDDAGTTSYPYVLKTNTLNYAAAKAQLVDFIRKVNGKGDESFKTWIPTVTDVELLLKTYAVNVAVGMWDDFWGNTNNYYIYFNTSDLYDYKFFFIPYDYDNTLGTSASFDPARQNPLQWGSNSRNLIARLLKISEYKKIYVDALKEICNSQEYMEMTACINRIKGWHSMISPYISNDTGEDLVIRDIPASWSNYGHYRLLDSGSDNYFRVKAETISSIR